MTPHLFALVLMLTSHGNTEVHVLDQHLTAGACVENMRKLKHAQPIKHVKLYYCSREL